MTDDPDPDGPRWPDRTRITWKELGDMRREIAAFRECRELLQKAVEAWESATPRADELPQKMWLSRDWYQKARELIQETEG